MKQLPTAAQFMYQNDILNPNRKITQIMIEFAKLHVQAALDSATENNAKIININTDHYVVVDDSEIKEGDWMLSKEGEIHNNFGWNFGDKKIIFSTKPIKVNY